MGVLLLGMWFLSGCTTTNNIEFPVVENNVAYSKVASLSFVNANEFIIVTCITIMWFLNFALPSIIGSYFVLNFKLPNTGE